MFITQWLISMEKNIAETQSLDKFSPVSNESGMMKHFGVKQLANLII